MKTFSFPIIGRWYTIQFFNDHYHHCFLSSGTWKLYSVICIRQSMVSMSRHPSFFVNNKVLTLRCVAIEFAKFLFRLSSNMSYKDGDIYFFGFSFLIAATSLNIITSTLYSIIFAVFWIWVFFFLFNWISIGPEKELLQLAAFGELLALFPGVQVHIEFIGPAIPQQRSVANLIIISLSI